MLIEFRVQNHRSIRSEQVLSMVAEGPIEGDTRPRRVTGAGDLLLPAAVIYGANASGKSNLLSAMQFLFDAVNFSHSLWDGNTGIPRQAFKWADGTNEPSLFEITFVSEGERYNYGFVVDDQVVIEEWLHFWPHGRKALGFNRENQIFQYGDQLSGPNRLIEGVTRNNALFLSVASLHKHPVLSQVQGWFRKMRSLNVRGSLFDTSTYLGRHSQLLQRFFGANTELELPSGQGQATDPIRQLLRSADTGIVNVRVSDSDDKRHARQRIQLQHKEGDETSWLPLEEESQGTKALFRLAVPVFETLNGSNLLIVDELEASLHPLLGLKILSVFNSPLLNPRNAQIIFTTHDSNLLGNTLGEAPLRRDQVWFTEKSCDGETTVYPLTKFSPRRTENLERGYLQGRYGAIPFLGELTRIPAE